MNRNQYGSPLQAAACATSNRNALVALLLDNKANVNLVGGEYGSALAAACYAGDLDVVRLLLGNGANVNVRGGRFGSVLRAAHFSQGGQAEKSQMVQMLEAAGARALTGVQSHDDDVWRLTPGGWTWLPPENRKDVTSAFGGNTDE